MAWLLLLMVSWGALAFGAVYDWARWPLLGACVAAGAWGFAKWVPVERRQPRGWLIGGVLLVMLAVSVQLVPLDRLTLHDVSPATHAFLREYDVRYARAAANDLEDRESLPRLTHPLSIDPPKTWAGLALLGALGFMLLGLERGLGGRDIRIIAPGVVGLGVLMSMIAIVQKGLWNGKVYGFWKPVAEGAVAFGPFINRNHFAGWMLLALPLSAAYFASMVARGMAGVKPGWRNRVIWFSTPAASRVILTGFGIMVMAFALTLTLSRSGIACFLLAMLLSAANVLRRQRTTKGRLLAMYLALLFVAAVAWVGIDAVGARFAQVDWRLGGRTGAWEDALRIHRSFPWFGTGLSTYGTATLVLQRFERATTHYSAAHNDYLQLLVEGGWMVAVPAILLIAVLAWQVYRRFREGLDGRTGYWLRLGALTGIVAIALQEVVDFSLQMPGNAVLFTILCAIVIRRASVKTHRA